MKMTYEVDRENDYSIGYWDKIAEFADRRMAIKAAFQCFDEDENEGDYRVVELTDGEWDEHTGWSISLPSYQLRKQECNCCGKLIRHRDMLLTRDCHGIPFRYVCKECYQKLMARGYDGEWYDDEEIEECW